MERCARSQSTRAELSQRCSVASRTLRPYLRCHLSAGVEAEFLSYAQSRPGHTFWETREPTTMTMSAFPTGNLAPCGRWVGSAAGSTPVGEVSEPCPVPPGHGTAPTDPSPGLAGCSGICGRRLRGWGRQQMPRWFLPSSWSREGY